MANFIKIPKINCVRLFEESGKFAYELLPDWEVNLNYCYKSNSSDKFTLQFGVVGGEIWHAGNYITAKLIDSNENQIGEFNVSEKLSSVISAYKHFEISDTFAVAVGDDYIEGIFYVKLEIKVGGTIVKFYSEPIYLKVLHENTVLLTATNDINDFDVVFDTTYSPAIVFNRRVEGGFPSDGFLPQAKDTFYKNQNYDQILLKSTPFNTHKLTIGDGFGVSNDIIEIINRMMSCSDFRVNGTQYTKNDGSKLEPSRVDRFYPFSSWQVELMQTENKFSDEIGLTGHTIVGYYDDNAIGFNETTAIGYI